MKRLLKIIVIAVVFAVTVSARRADMARELGDKGYDLEEEIRHRIERFVGHSIADINTGKLRDPRRFTFFKSFKTDTIYVFIWPSIPSDGWAYNYHVWNSVDTISFEYSRDYFPRRETGYFSDNFSELAHKILDRSYRKGEFENPEERCMGVNGRTVAAAMFITRNYKIVESKIDTLTIIRYGELY